MKLSWAPLSKRQETIINKCLTQILRAYETAKSIQVQIQALFTLEDLFGTRLGLAEGVLSSPSLEPTCLGEAPLAAGARSNFFSSYFQWSLWRWPCWLQVKHLWVSTSWARMARAIFTCRTGSSGRASSK